MKRGKKEGNGRGGECAVLQQSRDDSKAPENHTTELNRTEQGKSISVETSAKLRMSSIEFGNNVIMISRRCNMQERDETLSFKEHREVVGFITLGTLHHKLL